MGDVLQLVLGVDWLSETPADTVERLADSTTVRRLAARDAVYVSGDDPDRLFVLVEGRVGAWRSRPGAPADDTDDGVWYFISDVAGTTLCLENVITAIPYFATMQVIGDSAQILDIPAAALDELLAAHPATGIGIARHIARRLQAFTEETVDIATLDTSRRLAKYLLRLATPDGTTRAMTQIDLATRLGTSRQSVNAALSRFLVRGWTEHAGRGRYRIVDHAALARHAGDVTTSGVELFH